MARPEVDAIGPLRTENCGSMGWLIRYSEKPYGFINSRGVLLDHPHYFLSRQAAIDVIMQLVMGEKMFIIANDSDKFELRGAL